MNTQPTCTGCGIILGRSYIMLAIDKPRKRNVYLCPDCIERWRARDDELLRTLGLPGDAKFESRKEEK